MKRYAILMCRYTGKIGLTSMSARLFKEHPGEVLVCTSRDPVVYTPMRRGEVIKLGWVTGETLDQAFSRIPRSFYDYTRHTNSKSLSEEQATEASPDPGPDAS